MEQYTPHDVESSNACRVPECNSLSALGSRQIAKLRHRASLFPKFTQRSGNMSIVGP